MNNERQILENDGAMLEEMIVKMEPCLMSDAIRWPVAMRDKPQMSIGGCLMHLHRLEVKRSRLIEKEQVRLDAAIVQFNMALEGKVVLFRVPGAPGAS